jgi:hypothetical protein
VVVAETVMAETVMEEAVTVSAVTVMVPGSVPGAEAVVRATTVVPGDAVMRFPAMMPGACQRQARRRGYESRDHDRDRKDAYRLFHRVL